MDRKRVLIADDQVDVLEALKLLLKGRGIETRSVTSPREVVSAIESGDFDCVLMDLNYTRDTTSGREGLDLLTKLRTPDATLPIVVMTAWGSVDGAVEAMRSGARDDGAGRASALSGVPLRVPVGAWRSRRPPS